MRLVSATLVKSKTSRICARCEKKMPGGEEMWREVWYDDRMTTSYLHIRCEGEEETAEESRKSFLEHIDND